MIMLKGALLSALFAATSLVAVPAIAASVTVGSSDSGNCYPFNCNDSGVSVGQSIDYYQIYSSAAFSGPTSFNSISFFDYLGDGSDVVLNGSYSISFATTSAGVGSGYPVVPLSNVQSFFNGALGGQSGAVTINGATYSYNPASGNLVMHIVVNNQDLVPNGSGNGYFFADYTGSATTRAYLLSNGGPAAGTGALVTQFGLAGVPEPASWALMLTGFGGMGLMLRGRRAPAAA